MIKNYIKIAWRNLWKNKVFSAINFLGLAIGMTAVILIGIWVENELSFDRFHTNLDSLYKVYNRSAGAGEISVWNVTSGPLGKALEENFPEVANTARIYWSSERLFSFNDISIKATGNEVDDSFLSMFSFPLLQGNAENALDGANNIVITKTMAQKLFGKENPINKVIKIDNENNYKVTGVLKDLPANTEFDFDYLIPLKLSPTVMNNWGINTYYTYVQLKPNTEINDVNNKIKNLVPDNSEKYNWEIFLHPVSKLHLYSQFENGKVVGGRIDTVRLMIIIGILILGIACINFINLSTAQSSSRSREVGVRKIIGAGKYRLVSQFLCESLILTTMGGMAALAVAMISLPFFNRIIDSSLTIQYSNPLLWLGLLGTVLITGLLAGLYPAFFLSSFPPIKNLKGSLSGSRKSFSARKVLVILQFSIGIILVIATSIIYRQINYTQHRNTGYNIDNLIQVDIEGDIKKNYDLIKNDLLRQNAVTSISKTGWDVTLNGSNGSGFKWEGMEQESINFTLYRTGGNFAKTMGLKIKEGRDIDLNEFPADSSSVMINTTAAEKMGFEDPIGQLIRDNDKTLKIVGVFEDFIIGSPYSEAKPMLIFGNQEHNYNMVIRLNPQNSTLENLKVLEQVFNNYNPAYPFVYHFVDQDYAQKFKDEQQIATLSSLFAGLSIFISCLGLFGLATYMTKNRAKEISIRKVLGANSIIIVQLLSKEFITLVVIAIFIAIPISWYTMDQWLMDFSYRINIEWKNFIGASLLVILIALITVSFQAIKAAITNPVKSLRSE